MSQSQHKSYGYHPPAYDRPNCPQCGSRMWLARIEPYRPGYDRRLFECTQCNASMEAIVQYP